MAVHYPAKKLKLECIFFSLFSWDRRGGGGDGDRGVTKEMGEL